MEKKVEEKAEKHNAKKHKHAKKKYAPLIIVAVLVVIIVLAILLFSNKGGNIISNNNSEIKSIEVSPLELADNKEKYEGKEVKIINILVPDPLFALVNRTNVSDERLFIQPQKSTYCLYFNLTGKLQKDVSGKRDWIFLVDKFECVSKT